MHLSIHIDGNESDEKLRRIANAVLALGGLLLHEVDMTEAPEARRFFDVFAKYKATRTEPHVGVDNSDGTVGAEANSDGQWLGDSESKVGSTGGDVSTEGVVSTPCPEAIAEGTKILAARIEEEFVEGPPLPALPGNPPPSPANTPEVSNVVSTTDANGLPWDERIHSGSRAINADGTWRYRKNVPAETKQAVEEELRSFIDPQHDETPTIEVTAVKGTVRHVPAAPPIPPAPPSIPTIVTHSPQALGAPPVPTDLTRSYSDVVNLIMSRKIAPDVFRAILGSDLPTFAATCRTDAGAATLAFNALDHASRS
jgi:hypothetical protein